MNQPTATAVSYTVCPHDCPDTCGIRAEVSDGRVVSLRGDPDHPITQGWLCAKVDPYLEFVYHPDRLTHPLRRAGHRGSGRWQRIGWDEAIAEIATRWRAIIGQYGAAAILPYSYSGTLGLVQMGAASTRFWNRLGASRLRRSICGAAAEQATIATLGARLAPSYDNVLKSRTVVVWGSNPVSSGPHLMPFLRRAQRNGCRLIVIDPVRSRTARGAALHVAPRPGSDGALALGIAALLVERGRHDEDFLRRHCTGWPELRARLAEYPLQRVADVTGVAAAVIEEVADAYAEQPSAIVTSDGINRNRNGGQTVRAIAALPAITGSYGVAGGGLMYSTSDTVRWDAHSLHHARECPPAPRTVNMNRLGAALTGECSDPPLMGLYVFGANPAAISPNAGLITEGLKRDDLFTVVHELFMTDTADYADIVLPATSQLEHTDLHKAYGHTCVALNTPLVAPIGESKSNWDVMRLLSGAMGFDEPWLHQDAAQVIDEVLVASAVAEPRLKSVTLARLRREPVIDMGGDRLPFADRSFPTPSGKVELYAQSLADQGLDPLPGWSEAPDMAAPPDDCDPDDGLDLITAAAHHFVSSSFANSERLRAREQEPLLDIHPEDAARRGIGDGDTVTVSNRRGWCRLRVRLGDVVRPGVVASPKGWWSKHHGGRNINWTTPDTLADMAGQSTFQTNRVWVAKA